MPDPGPVEASVRAFVEGLGALDARRRVASENAIRLAALMDLEEGSAAAAVSRELRLVMSGLDAVVPLAPAAGAPADVRADPVTQARDDVARKRQQRAVRASGGL